MIPQNENFKDNLVECPLCKCDACYKSPLNETHFSYLCFGCGFQTTDFLKEGEIDFTELEIGYPDLYIDLARIDSEKRKWYPASINIIEKGTVFINGTSVSDAQWAGVKTRKLSEEEKSVLPKNKNIEYLSDPKTLKMFGSSFLDACEYIGLFTN